MIIYVVLSPHFDSELIDRLAIVSHLSAQRLVCVDECVSVQSIGRGQQRSSFKQIHKCFHCMSAHLVLRQQILVFLLHALKSFFKLVHFLGSCVV